MNGCYKKEKYKTAGGFYWHFKDDKDIVNVQLSLFDEKQQVTLRPRQVQRIQQRIIIY